VLKGYAGTGKTSVIGALVKSLGNFNIKTCLLAPTGRAAKVLSKHSEKTATTIHREIYVPIVKSGGYPGFSLKDNKRRNTLFIVDEASMLAAENNSMSNEWQAQSLLDDLIEYVFSGDNCKLIFIGDTAQLPPVGSSLSPALNPEFLKSTYWMPVFSFELKQVSRQALDSGILFNATELRQNINNNIPEFILHNNDTDFVAITGQELEERLNDTIQQYGIDQNLVITYSNKRANLFNEQIRRRILWFENQIDAGDKLMVVKNNYFWLPEESDIGFIANGDTLEVLSTGRFEELYGLHFLNSEVSMIDYSNAPNFETKILLDTLHLETPSLPQAVHHKLFELILDDYQDIPEKRKRLSMVMKNPYYNALQVKFAYAVTCHKAQGGQWDVVYIDPGYLSPEKIDVNYLRWLYTAVTRATKQVFLVNFPNELLENPVEFW
ncbi:MAG TPA: ATP-dependent endonuclease, partial [Flavobacteriales bacterium]|nr:ATP-dependent endonuclease [Flavobacteriales bacterium]